MKRLIKKHHKVGLSLVATGVLLFVASFLAPAISSYLIVAGIGLVLIGLLVINPYLLPF